MSPGLPSPPRPGPGAALAALRDDLAEAGYTVEGVTARLGEVASRALARDAAVPARRELAGADDPVAVLLRLFTLGGTVPAGRVASALPRCGVDGLLEVGLVEAAGGSGSPGSRDELRATVDIQPHAVADDSGEAAWWVVSDLGEVALGGGMLPPEHVLGVGAASMTLVDAVVPGEPGQRALDVGTGSAVQALHLSRSCSDLVATDVSARACAFARVTAELNGVALDVRQGSLLQPATSGDGSAPERFDRVVANLPFVVTPRRSDLPRYTYRDAGLPGDDVVRRMLVDAPRHLAPGGLAIFLGNWEDRTGEGWRARLRVWVDEAAERLATATGGTDVLDSWIVQRELADPGLYAEAWLADGGRPEPAVADAWYRAWLDDFAARGVDGVGFGVVTLRRRPADLRCPPLRRLDSELGTIPGPWRDVVAAGLAGYDALGRLDALGGAGVPSPAGGTQVESTPAVPGGAASDLAGLLTARLVRAPGVVERREHEPGAADPRWVRLVDTRRRGRVVEASSALAGLVGACDGELSVGAVTAALAELLGEPEGTLREAVLPAVRDLVLDGLLTVVPDPSHRHPSR